MIRVLFIGDICGSIGIKMCKESIASLKKSGEEFDFIVVNGENSAGGLGITYPIVKELFGMGVDVITLGNHTWNRKEILNFIDDEKRVIRPVNFSKEAPGRGSVIFKKGDKKIGIINVMGRVYMDPVNCPFEMCDRELSEIKKETKCVIVDIHAEATSEKCALAWHLDGRVSAVLGTHTHVQTADERIFDCGTGFISDVGMTGPYDGVIGADKEVVLRRFIMGMPERFESARGKAQFNAVILQIDEANGKCIFIERVQMIEN